MKLVHSIVVVVATAGLLVGAAATQGQPPNEGATERFLTARAVPSGADLRTEPAFGDGQDCGLLCSPRPGPGLYAGADFLLIRPHFSEAVAFAQGVQTLTTFQTEGRPLAFDYAPSFRAFGGFRFDDGRAAIEFNYRHVRGETQVDGTAPGAGEFIVDPFGNVVGAVVVVDPRDARFGTMVVGGDLIRTEATVQMNVYDLDLMRSFSPEDPRWDFRWSAGVRIADINQFYESVITLQGSPLTRGDFSVDFIGAGPRLGLEGRRYFGAEGRFSLFANARAALLVGTYDVASSNTVTPVGFSASQRESMTRTIPVVETEVGAAWRVTDSLNLSAGWSFEAWFDLGTSGGQFGGFFAGADDANIMSLDGLFVRAEWRF